MPRRKVKVEQITKISYRTDDVLAIIDSKHDILLTGVHGSHALKWEFLHRQGIKDLPEDEVLDKFRDFAQQAKVQIVQLDATYTVVLGDKHHDCDVDS